MTTPQDPPVRNKQKRRRAKKLAAWREKNAAATAGTDAKSTGGKGPVKKVAAAKATK
jgi:hypothetical protein